MTFFIILVRIPFGILASLFLIGWTFAFGAWFCIRFGYYAVFGNRRSIENKLIPWFHKHEGTHVLPDVWKWVLTPDSGGDFDDFGKS